MQSWYPAADPESDQTTLSYIINLKTLEVVWVEAQYEDIKSIAGRAVDFDRLDWSKLEIICFDSLFGPRCN